MATLDQDDLNAIAALLQPIQNDLTALLQMQVGNGTAIEAFTTAGGTRLAVAIQGSVTGSVNGFTITASGGAVTVLDFELKKISTQEITAVILRLSRTIVASERVHVGYTSNPGSGGGNLFVDSSFVPSFSNVLVRTESGIDNIITDISETLTSLENKAAFGFTVIPAVRSSGTKIDISTFVGEQQSPVIPLAIDLRDEELELVWEPATEKNLTEIAVLTTDDLNLTETSIQFRLPQSVYSRVRQFKYSLRRVDETSESSEPDKVVIFQGIWTIMSTSLKR
jgi:hypothetical protein